jgi:MGT family glycosyltransferase
VLSLHALEFEFPHRPPERVRYVGPLLLESRLDRPMAGEGRAELDSILERRRRAQGERKLIYAAFGSVFSTDLAFLQRLLGVVAERPDWDLVISLSDQIAPTDLGRLPERVHAFRWVPQMSVLKHADVAVTHGGINTIDECVVNGVPMLVYCGLETDMAGNTARVVHHGLGIDGDRRRDDTPIIREHIDRLLDDPRFENNVERLRNCYLAYAEKRVAERAVEALLGRESGPSDRSGPPGAPGGGS